MSSKPGWALRFVQEREELSSDMEPLLEQIVDQIRDLKEHGYGRVEIIVRGGLVTTLHSQKTWVRKGDKSVSPR